MYSLLVLLTTTAACTMEGEADWAEILRDAQVTNQAKLQRGFTRMSITYNPGTGADDILIHCEVTWDKDKSLQKFKLHGPAGSVLGRDDVAKPLSDQQYDEILSTGREILWYVPSQGVVQLSSAADDIPIDGLLHFSPRDLWTKCCPPGSGAHGRPWQEMLGLKAVGKAGEESIIEFKRADHQIIRQTRRDPGGGVLTMDFSLDQGGNVVAMNYKGPKSRGGYDKSTYRWKRLGDAYVLESCEHVKQYAADIAKTIGVTSLQTYSLHVEECKLGTIDGKLLSKQVFLDLLPPKTKLVDRSKNSVTILRKSDERAPPSEEQFDALTRDLKKATKGEK